MAEPLRCDDCGVVLICDPGTPCPECQRPLYASTTCDECGAPAGGHYLTCSHTPELLREAHAARETLRWGLVQAVAKALQAAADTGMPILANESAAHARTLRTALELFERRQEIG